jgi:hypothetical protein
MTGHRIARALASAARQLRPAVERVAFLAGFDLDEFGHDIEAHFLREPGQRFSLRFDAETGTRRADPDVKRLSIS